MTDKQDVKFPEHSTNRIDAPSAMAEFEKLELMGAHAMHESEGFSKKVRSARWWKRMVGYAGLALLSFFIFLYLSFPYAVLKEGIVASVSDSLRASGLEIRLNVGKLRPSWFTGVVLEDVTLSNLRDSSAQVRFSQVTARLRLLPLLIGRAGVSLEVEQAKGRMNVGLGIPIFSAIMGHPSLAEADIAFKDFAIDSFVAQGLAILKGSTNPAMALVLPIISVTTAGGALTGKIDLGGSELSVPERIKGRVDLQVKGMYLHIADNVWQIPRQEFSVARIAATLENGAVVVGNATSFVASDIDVTLGGKLTPSPSGMDAALSLKIAMRRRIQQNIGNLVPAMLKCIQPPKENTLQDGTKEMVIEGRLTGPLASMQCEQG